MVVNSKSCEKHVEDLNEMFVELRKNNMRLNLEKCVFRVEGGKFLGFKLTHRGIKANMANVELSLRYEAPEM